MSNVGTIVQGIREEHRLLPVARAIAAEYFLRTNTAEWYDWRIRNSEHPLRHKVGKFVHVVLGGYAPDAVLAYSLASLPNHEFALAPVLIGEGVRIASICRHHFYRRQASRKQDLEERV